MPPLPRPHPLLDAYAARRDALRRLFSARIGESEADDLLQDLFVKLSGLDGEAIGDPEAYVFRLAYNLATDWRRARLRRSGREDRWMREGRASVGRDWTVDEPAADDALAARQELASVMSVVAALPSRTAEVFRLHKLEGLSHREVAERLGVSRSAVEKHMSRVLAELGRRLRHG